MNDEDDIGHMRTAIAASRDALSNGNMPFGAVLVNGGKALLVAMNEQTTAADCTGHAEVVLVREAQKTLGRASLLGATVFASGEPCAMCSGAMFWAGVKRVVYAAPTPAIDSVLGGPSLGARCAEVLAKASPEVRVEGPLLEAEAVSVLKEAAGQDAM